MISENDTVIFDLDGTLVKSSAFDNVCYQEALQEVLGHSNFNTNWETYEHVTDTGLLTEILFNLGTAEPDITIKRVREIFGEKINRYLVSGGECNPVPGAIETINQLIACGFKVGIATGGWEHTARMKLRAAGFDMPVLLSSSDDAMDRPGIMRHCCEKIGGNPERAVYFGDANWDVKATKKLGWRFIGIGQHFSGICSDWIVDYHDPKWPYSPQNI